MKKQSTSSKLENFNKQSLKLNHRPQTASQQTLWSQKFSTTISIPNQQLPMIQKASPYSPTNLQIQKIASEQSLKVNVGGSQMISQLNESKKQSISDEIKQGFQQFRTSYKEPSERLKRYVKIHPIEESYKRSSLQQQSNQQTSDQLQLAEDCSTGEQSYKQIDDATFKSNECDSEQLLRIEQKYKPKKYSQIEFNPPTPQIAIHKDKVKPLDLVALEQNRKTLLSLLMDRDNKDQRLRLNDQVFKEVKDQNINKVKSEFLNLQLQSRKQHQKKILLSRRYIDQVGFEIRFLPKLYREKLQKKLKWYIAKDINMDLEIDQKYLKGCQVDFKKTLDEYFVNNLNK